MHIIIVDCLVIFSSLYYKHPQKIIDLAQFFLDCSSTNNLSVAIEHNHIWYVLLTVLYLTFFMSG